MVLNFWFNVVKFRAIFEHLGLEIEFLDDLQLFYPRRAQVRRSQLEAREWCIFPTFLFNVVNFRTIFEHLGLNIEFLGDFQLVLPPSGTSPMI